MPHSLSAKKRVRQNVRRRAVNKTVKTRIRSARRAFLKAIETGDAAAAREKLKAVAHLLHRAANRGPFHRNTSARAISRMQTRLTNLEKTPKAQ